MTPAVFLSAESREDLLFLEEQSLWMHLISFCLKQQLERVCFSYYLLIYLFIFLHQPEWPKSKTNVFQRALLCSTELAQVN